MASNLVAMKSSLRSWTCAKTPFKNTCCRCCWHHLNLNLRYKKTWSTGQLDNHCFPYKNHLQKSWVFHIYVTLEAPETSHTSQARPAPPETGPFHEVKNLSIINMSASIKNQQHERIEETDNWLVVWNIFYFSIYWEWSSQLTNIFQRGWNHQPDKFVVYWMIYGSRQYTSTGYLGGSYP